MAESSPNIPYNPLKPFTEEALREELLRRGSNVPDANFLSLNDIFSQLSARFSAVVVVMREFEKPKQNTIPDIHVHRSGLAETPLTAIGMLWNAGCQVNATNWPVVVAGTPPPDAEPGRPVVDEGH